MLKNLDFIIVMTNLNVVLIASANYEDVTRIIHKWSRDVVHNAVDAGNSVYVMDQEQYSRDNLRSSLLSFQPAFFFGMGHGLYFLTSGYNGEVTIQSKTEYMKNGQWYEAPDINMDIVDGVVYLLSCQTGRKLGKDMVEKGTKSFIGYDADFVFFTSSNPLTSKIYEGYYMRPAMKIADSLCKGKTTKQAYNDAIEEFEKSINSLHYSPDPNAAIMINTLYDDKNALVLHGDENAVVSILEETPPEEVKAAIPQWIIYGLFAGWLYSMLKK